MRRILVVEGSDHMSPRQAKSNLKVLWDEFCDCLALPRFDQVVPISKRCIADLSDRDAQAALDDELLRLNLGQPDHALLLAWDSKPPWASVLSGNKACRYRETVALYQALDERARVPAALRPQIAARRKDFESRQTASHKISPSTRLVAGSLLALCMDPQFESLFEEEDIVKAALGLSGQAVADWPPNWKKRFPADPKRLLDQAILAAGRHPQRPEIVQKIGLDYTRKQEAWAAHFIRSFAQHRPDAFRRHRICQRLLSLLGT